MAKNGPKDFLLYSTNTELAYEIAKKYYNKTFFVWCTDAFDSPLQPGTSNPRTLCNRFLDQIIKNDGHAKEIENNKVGILRGAQAQFEQGVITKEQHKEIKDIVGFFPTIMLFW